MLNKNLTICIPTYNRKEQVSELITSILQSNLLTEAKLFVVDDGSRDNTFDELRQLLSIRKEVRFVYQEHKGLAHTFLNFFTECDTDYLMIVADDDMLLPEGIHALIGFLNEVSPDFVSTAWLANDTKRTYCRGKKILKKIELAEILHASSHAPGLIYRVESFKTIVTIMKERLKTDCYLSNIFPQVVMLLYRTLQTENFWWHPTPIGGYTIKGALKSQLCDNNGHHWSSLIGRWQEQLSFARLFSEFVNMAPNVSKKHAYEQMMRSHNASVYLRLRNAIATETPHLLSLFDGGSVFYNFRYFFTRMKALWSYLITRFN